MGARRDATAWIGVLVVALVVGLGGPAPAADLKLGSTLSLTGGTDDYGKGALMGLTLPVEEYNAKGAYKGQKVELVVYDDETKPPNGEEDGPRLITRDPGAGIMGTATSGVALAILVIAQKMEMPLMDTIAPSEPNID